MPSLFEHAAEYRRAAASLEELDLTEEEIAQALDQFGQDFEARVLTLVRSAQNLRAVMEGMEKAMDRLKARYTAAEKRCERLEATAVDVMRVANRTNVRCDEFEVRTQANGPRVDVLDAARIPAKYWRTPDPKPIEPIVNKKLILEEWRNNPTLLVDGVRIVQRDRLVVK